MAETKLAMSLDALIAQAGKRKERKPQAPRQAGGQAPQSGPRKGLNKNRQNNSNGAAPQRAPKQVPQQVPQQQQQQPQPQRQSQPGQRNRKGGANLGVRGGQVQKRAVIEVPAKALRQQQPVLVPQRNKAFQSRQPAPEGKWQHDLFVDDYAPPRRAPVSQVAASSAKLIIKNLYHQVSADDLLELFSTCGTVKSHGVNYDTSGRSVGTGWVMFETRMEAEVAKKEYNNVKLDGQAMSIYFTEEVAGAPLKKLSSGIVVQRAAAGGGGGAGSGGGGAGGSGPSGGSGGQRLAVAAIRETAAASRGGRGGGPRGNRLRSTVVGRAQLDKDLQDYMQE